MKQPKLTADYKLIPPLTCNSCGQQKVYYKYGRFSDMCICENCNTNQPDFKYFQNQPHEFEFKNLLCLYYGNKQPRPLLIILAGYGCNAKRTFKMSRYAKWADLFGFNLLYLADKNLYWNIGNRNSAIVIDELLNTTTYSNLFKSISDISVMGHSNGGIMMATLAVMMQLKNVVFISGFVPEAFQIIERNWRNYFHYNNANTLIMDNTKDEGFTENNKFVAKFLDSKGIKYTTITTDTGHNLRSPGSKMFIHLKSTYQPKSKTANIF